MAKYRDLVRFHGGLTCFNEVLTEISLSNMWELMGNDGKYWDIMGYGLRDHASSFNGLILSRFIASIPSADLCLLNKYNLTR